MADEPVTPIVRDPARLAEALPWYVNGTLSADDRAWVEALLDEDPGAASQAGFDRLVQAELNARLAEVPADIGWTRLLARARSDAASPPARRRWLTRIVDAVGQWMTPQWAMALAVLSRYRTPSFASYDVFAATVGGMRITEPAVDLAVCLALESAGLDVPVPPGLVAIGEVGLAGDLRRVTGLARRLAEAARMGFTTALVPPDSGRHPAGLRVIEVADLPAALRQARLRE